MESRNSINENSEEFIAKIYLLFISNFIQYLNILNNVFPPTYQFEKDSSYFFEFYVGDISAFFSSFFGLDCFFPSTVNILLSWQ